MEPIIRLDVTEDYLRELVGGASWGDAIGETPMDPEVFIVVVRKFRDDILKAMEEAMEDQLLRLADTYARIDKPTIRMGG